MRLKTKRWNDPPESDDGFRLLICRYRPRGLAKKDETWDAWQAELGPTRALSLTPMASLAVSELH